MNEDLQILELERIAEALISERPDFFLVEIKIRPGNNIKIFIDGDQGIGIDALAQYNRSLYKKIEEKGIFPNNDFSLEVSSPGLDEPLKLNRQYLKNIGRKVETILRNGIKIEGKLLGVTETEIMIEEEKGNKKRKELLQHSIPFENIKSTKIQVKW